ncbi:homoserine dehydrogenase [Massiliimalia massiliensis]|uniref:homoserine dehydrogenase n=1 Tax=Massiliimalia massiliensis TaxID=1852384 RepID=UPI0009864E1C|nr:homoserine dehydrogenase [Massiliimalia massiliensis]
MINIAVLGHGVVGSGVVEVVETNQEYIAKNAGDNIYVKRILDLRDFDVPYADKFTKDYADILNDPEISIVVEVMGGINPSYDFAKAALKHGKSVVTSNKELVAAKGAKLLRLAKENHVNFYFEASVGGGIPIIRPLHSCLAANQIDEIAGILNGTTNFILTKMITEQMQFDEALKLAQALGYAERNPTADVDGHDACRKICILASLAYGKQIYPENVPTEGIGHVTLEDVDYAESNDCVIKLIGRVKKLDDEGNVLCMVSPALLNKQSQLAGITDVFNGILVRGNATGDVVFYGRGAGKLPTASAVVADVIDVAKASDTTSSLTWVDDGVNHVVDYRTTCCDYYVRISACDNRQAREKIKELFGEVKYLSRPEQPENELAVVMENILEQDLIDKEKILNADSIYIVNKIRILNY